MTPKSEWVSVQKPAKRENSNLIRAGVITAILLPIVGFVIGIVLMTRRDDRWGLGILVGSVIAAIFWFNQLQPEPTVTVYQY